MPMNRPKSFDEIEAARRHLTARLEARGVWFLRESRDGRAVELHRGEWELCASARSLVLSYVGESGARTWRVSAWRAEGDSLFLEAARRMGAQRALLQLVPRALVSSARETVASARRSECERLAALVRAFARAKIERAGLSPGARRGEPGRWARIILNRGAHARIAVTTPVVPTCAGDAEGFLSSALLWLARLEDGARATRIGSLWLVAPRALASAVRERVSLLREDLRARTSVFKFNEEADGLTQLIIPTLAELLDAPRLTRHVAAAEVHPYELTASVVSLAPDEIDFVRARHGETLRFKGLPFARVRRVGEREHIWFGVEDASRRRTLLDEESAHGFIKLINELREHRRAEAPDRKHALYRAAPEAWLEALLRRDVTRLDPALRLAPLHAQFRTPLASGARPVDLLALRRDGRLVIIELKVAEDAALAIQGADYWRRISAYHHAGHIERARLFGDAEISDESPLVYLVAPMLRFHRSFETLALAVRPEIEMYRFDINEDWRAGVRVVRRTRIIRVEGRRVE
jgi:hypothetical protein